MLSKGKKYATFCSPQTTQLPNLLNLGQDSFANCTSNELLQLKYDCTHTSCVRKVLLYINHSVMLKKMSIYNRNFQFHFEDYRELRKSKKLSRIKQV